MQQHSGVLVEQSINDLQFMSPDHFEIKLDSLGPCNRTLTNQFSRRLGNTSNQVADSESALGGDPCLPSVVISTTISRKEDGSQLGSAVSAQAAPPSNPHVIIAGSSGTDAGAENFSMYASVTFCFSVYYFFSHLNWSVMTQFFY